MSKSFFSEKFPAQFHQQLREESKLWEEENLISPEQREAILLRYDIIARHQSFFVPFLTFRE